MSEKRRQNNTSIIPKTNNLGTALFIFVVLTGAILWFSGNLHFGSRVLAEVEVLDTGHGHEQEAQTDELICQEHGFPESICVQCNPSLAATYKAKGDWCTEHNLPESQCTICNPDLRKSSTVDAGSTTDLKAIAGSTADLKALEEAMCEHGMRTIDCDTCRYELGVVKLQPSVANALIETTVVKNTPRTTTLKLTGQVQLDKTRTVDVVSTGSGQVRRVQKLLGQEVAKGETLAVIHSADLGAGKAQFLEVQARLELATSTFEREKELYEKKISSQADYLSASSELKAAQAYYAAAERRLHLFGLGTEQINTIRNEKENGLFAELLLRAPQSGTIIAQNVSAGALVDTTESLYTIADLSNVWVWYDLYEKDLAVLHDRLSSGSTGVVDLIGSQVDEHTRTVKLRVQVKNEQHKLRPGMFAEAEISIPLKGSMTVVPSSAVLSDEGKAFVFQLLRDDMWIRRDVRVGENQEGLVEVLNGIPKGATIVSRGAFMLKSDILREKMGAGCAD